ncbi:hypothetical protein BDZ89DRAFT_418887 [Hymenopellis radicata]|nr:hypothetical protein BDZ89DRAFT_418887 [Hymenopellis radicata]
MLLDASKLTQYASRRFWSYKSCVTESTVRSTLHFRCFSLSADITSLICAQCTLISDFMDMTERVDFRPKFHLVAQHEYWRHCEVKYAGRCLLAIQRMYLTSGVQEGRNNCAQPHAMLNLFYQERLHDGPSSVLQRLRCVVTGCWGASGTDARRMQYPRRYKNASALSV